MAVWDLVFAKVKHDNLSNNNNNQPNYFNMLIFRFSRGGLCLFMPQVVYYHQCEALIKLIIHKLAIKHLFRWTAQGTTGGKILSKAPLKMLTSLDPLRKENKQDRNSCLFVLKKTKEYRWLPLLT